MTLRDTVRPSALRSFAAVCVLAALALASCGGGDEAPGPDGLSDPGDLAGRAIGVASTTNIAALETRFVLREVYGLTTDSVTFEEASADSLLDLLRAGEIAAAALPPQAAFQLEQDESVFVLSHVTQEMRDITGAPVMSSALVTYPEVLAGASDVAGAVNDLLQQSATYLEANRQAIIAALVDEQGLNEELLGWLAERQALALGDLSPAVQEQVLDVWEAALTLGDIEALPAIEDLLALGAEGENAARASDGDRVTVSLAVRDAPLHRVALYAIERGLVTSDTVDLDITFLSQTELAEAAAARQYDVIELPAVAIPMGLARGLEFRILSGGLQDLDSTLLFVLARRGD